MRNRVLAVSVASVLVAWSAFGSRSAVASDVSGVYGWDSSTVVLRKGELSVQGMISAFGADLEVLGRVDGLQDQQLLVVGQRIVTAQELDVSIGDYVAVRGTRLSDGSVIADSITVVGEQYVPGASTVFVRGMAPSGLDSIGSASVGGQAVDFTPLMGGADLFAADWSSRDVSVLGVQPLLGGVVLARDVAFLARKSGSGSLGTGKTASGSLGTGKSSNGSLGTGKTASGSLGTGKSSNGSLGTGKTASGSLGTGKSSSGSLGTGKTASGSLGTGKSSSGSLGTGKTASGSLGTGKSSNGSLGTGKTASGSLGTGKSSSGSLGTGKTASGSLGTGKSSSGSLGTGKTASGSLGTGRTKD